MANSSGLRTSIHDRRMRPRLPQPTLSGKRVSNRNIEKSPPAGIGHAYGPHVMGPHPRTFGRRRQPAISRSRQSFPGRLPVDVEHRHRESEPEDARFRMPDGSQIDRLRGEPDGCEALKEAAYPRLHYRAQPPVP